MPNNHEYSTGHLPVFNYYNLFELVLSAIQTSINQSDSSPRKLCRLQNKESMSFVTNIYIFSLPAILKEMWK